MLHASTEDTAPAAAPPPRPSRRPSQSFAHEFPLREAGALQQLSEAFEPPVACFVDGGRVRGPAAGDLDAQWLSAG